MLIQGAISDIKITGLPMKNFFPRVSLVSAIFLVLTGCVDQATSGDTTKQDINRANGVADQIESQYAAVKGQFVGTYNSSTILLTLDVARQSSNGLAPQPTIVGNLSLSPPVFVDNSGQPMMIPYIVTSGQYVGGNDLSLTIQANGNPTTLHCKVEGQSNLACNWYLNSSAPRASFTLNRIPDGQIPQPPSREYSGAYVGQNSDFAQIRANFRTFLVPQNGSLGVPQVSIVGSFTFSPWPTDEQKKNHRNPGSANFPFIDSQFDPITSTVAMRINGDNPIQVNCVIRTAAAMKCTWIGTHGGTSYENFDLVKAN